MIMSFKKGDKKRAKIIFEKLKDQYGEVESALEYNSPFQLLIATILSAQCTDKRVNIVTKELFKKYKLPEDFLRVDSSELEKDIFSTGFYRQKAKSIKNCCRVLVEVHKGKIPNDFDMLIKLPGVGRKTASVIAGNAFGIPAFAVDTHVLRLSNLWKFANTKDAYKIEITMKELLPEKYWIEASHLIATHGRRICNARKPKCSECFITEYCPSGKLNHN
jgi:endonuclease-3